MPTPEQFLSSCKLIYPKNIVLKQFHHIWMCEIELTDGEADTKQYKVRNQYGKMLFTSTVKVGISSARFEEKVRCLAEKYMFEVVGWYNN